MIRRRVDTKPEIIRDQPACRIFGEPIFCQFPVGSTVRVPMWYAENSQRMEVNCGDMPTALAWIEKIRQGELDQLLQYWSRFPADG